LGSSRSSDSNNELDPSNGSSTDEFDGEDDETAATSSAESRNQEAVDDDDDDDYYRPQPPAASRLKSKKEKKTHWAWPTSVGLLTLSVIGLAGFAWYQSTQQEEAMRSMQLKLRQAQQTPQAEAPAQNEGQIQALQDELGSTRKLHSEEIAELEDRNQTLEAKLSSVERALKIARADAAKASNASAPPSVASSPQPQSSSSSGWFINIQTYATRADADAMVARLSSSSESFGVQPAQVNGRTLYRVRASGYADQSEAEEVAAELVEAFALPKPWIGRDR
jgi:cell division septation protein DedD